MGLIDRIFGMMLGSGGSLIRDTAEVFLKTLKKVLRVKRLCAAMLWRSLRKSLQSRRGACLIGSWMR